MNNFFMICQMLLRTFIWHLCKCKEETLQRHRNNQFPCLPVSISVYLWETIQLWKVKRALYTKRELWQHREGASPTHVVRHPDTRYKPSPHQLITCIATKRDWNLVSWPGMSTPLASELTVSCSLPSCSLARHWHSDTATAAEISSEATELRAGRQPRAARTQRKWK